MKKWLNIIGLLVLAGTVNAQFDQGGHLHGEQMEMFSPPHGGQLEDLGKYKIELVTNLFQKENQLKFYLFKGEMKPLSIEEVKGTMTLKYNDGTIEVSELTAIGNDFFVGTINTAKSYTCTVEFTIKKKIISTEYAHKGVGEVRYTCVMHPEIDVLSPGKCEVCGMDLVEKKEQPKEQPKEKVEHKHSH